jgi:hypothetical protein
MNISWGEDLKNNENKLVMLGPSFTLHANSWLDVGVGGGIAWFSSANYESFTKFYLEPARVDFRPVGPGHAAFCAIFDKCFRPDSKWRDWFPVPIDQLGIYFDLEVPLTKAGR